MHQHNKLRLSTSSFLLHSEPSLSQATLNTASPSFENFEINRQNDIFQAKTQSEISHNYNKILLTYGKWNAEAYLKILKELNVEDKEEMWDLNACPLQNLGRLKGEDTKPTADHHKHHIVPPKYDNITKKDCRLHKTDLDSTKLAPLQEDSDFPPERTYKKIFKNVKLKRELVGDESLGILLLNSTIKKIEKKLTIEEESTQDHLIFVREKPCKLMKNEPNNYLLDIRRSRSEKDKKKVSFGSQTEAHMDDIERYYQNKHMRTVLENNLEDQIELMKASLKSHVSDVSGIDLLRETGYNDLKGRCLDDFSNINTFQNMFDDSRWRKKFDLGRIEESDDANSLDVSDIASSESSSVCSGDSLGTELDYKLKPITPSRIPCIAEIRDMGDILFDKIAMKWEKVVKKNFIDPDMKPIFRHFSNAVRLRSTAPVYSDIMKLLEPYDNIYVKKYTPHRYRMTDKLERMGDMQEAKNALVRHRREFESCQLRRGSARRRSPGRYVGMQEPTKYQGKNQRQRLKSIIRDTKHRDGEGLTNWTKRNIIEDYVNLTPIIQTKNSHKNRSTAINKPSVQSPQKPSRSLGKFSSVRSLRNVETSLFLGFPRSPSPDRNKLISRSKSKIRMPI